MTNKSRSKLLKELQDYNKQLGKHLPDVDVEKIAELKGAIENSEDDDYYSLLATNFMELRTEVALLRKNLSNDIEAMVLKQVVELQNKFFKQLGDFSSKIVFDIKENLGNYVNELNNNVLDIKREFNKLSTKNEIIENRFEELNESTRDFNSYVDKLDYSQKNAFKHLDNEIQKIYMQNSSSFAKVVDRLNSEIRASRDAFRRLGLELSESNSHIKKEITTIKEHSKKPILIEKPHEEEYKITSFEDKPVSKKKENKIEEEVPDFSSVNPKKVFEEEDETLFSEKKDRLLEIDKRINNLQNLK